MWEIKLEVEAAKILADGSLNDDSIFIIEQWFRLVAIKGPKALLRANAHWRDHLLQGAWFGYRSSRFSNSGRIIYRVDKKWQRVIVVRITENHDYLRRND